MLRKALFAAALFAATLSSSAHSGDYVEGRVISVVPHLSLQFGSLRHDGFRVEYELGGQRYNTHSHHRPERVILVPPPFRAGFLPPHFPPRVGHWRDDHRDDRRGWRGHDRWDDHRHGHRHDGRGDGRGHGRKHGRH